jgi:arylsulfatase A-like enzyme
MMSLHIRHPLRLLILFVLSSQISFSHSNSDHPKPNVIVILADDLGYGDTSVPPFRGSNIQTPELEKMAKRGMKWTNFHMAAPTCTPSRLSILTGLYPWRLGAAAVFEYGAKGPSNRDDWLIQVPTAAMIFRDANYSTIHSGKWHMGGMRNDDLNLRVKYNEGGVCPHPGPNQMGFENYVSVLDGPGAPRQNELQVGNILHSFGGRFMLKNDQEHICTDDILSDCEVNNAIELMKESLAKNKPFYAHIWFHAPHGPWEVIIITTDIIYDYISFTC